MGYGVPQRGSVYKQLIYGVTPYQRKTFTEKWAVFEAYHRVMFDCHFDRYPGHKTAYSLFYVIHNMQGRKCSACSLRR